jgi:hypothetical protein
MFIHFCLTNAIIYFIGESDKGGYMDIEQINVSVDDNKIKKISKACQDMQELGRQIEEKEKEMAELSKKHKELQEQTIPELMQEAGVSLIKTENGDTVEVKPVISARIPASRTEEAFNWLRSNGHEDMIKNTVTASFNKGQDNLVSRLIQVCEENGFTYNKKEKVEPMTLKAFAREQITDGKELPMDLFGVYVSNKTKITKN